jgi:hypothetical protein
MTAICLYPLSLTHTHGKSDNYRKMRSALKRARKHPHSSHVAEIDSEICHRSVSGRAENFLGVFCYAEGVVVRGYIGEEKEEIRQ